MSDLESVVPVNPVDMRAGQRGAMTFSVVVCVSDQDLLRKALGSCLEKAHAEPVELIAIDNSTNQYSGPQALNLGAARAHGDVVVFLHQDVLLSGGWFQRLSDQIAIVEGTSGNWGVLGVFGVSGGGRMVGHIKDPHGYRKWGRLPCPVQSLDEVCLAVRRESGLRFDEDLGGFHFYGADICLQARRQGLGCYAIDACLEHLSGGKVDGRFWEMAGRFETKWRGIPGGPAVVETTCGVFRMRTDVRAAGVFAFAKFRRKVWRRLCRPTTAGRAWESQ